jgi:hypothetical protein
MAWWRGGVVGAFVLLGLAAPSSEVLARRPLPEACPGGRFPIAGDPLVPGGASDDGIEIDGTQVAIDSGCPAVAARRKRTRSGTRLVARWKSCGTLAGPVRLVVKLDAATCASLTGRFRARRVRRTLAAQVETPADAFGRVSDPLPDGAVLLTPEEWDQAKQRPDFRSIGPDQVNADRAAEDAAAAADAQVVMDYVSQNPALAPQLLGGVDPERSGRGPG